MILDFRPERRAGSGERVDTVLRGLRAYWEFSRTDAPLPLSEHLFLSDLVDEMPHVVLAYHDNQRFQVEFAGEAAADLLGGSPIGATTGPNGGLPPALARCIRRSAERREPVVSTAAGFRIICLPFGAVSGDVDLVLAGLAEVAMLETGGTVVSLMR
ncbi:hypothetical protein [Nisaea sp.]|uniref:hypothetical protein n=1 Tax=Nisaea sp. TaxID=2024842 RepID=UPI003B520B18